MMPFIGPLPAHIVGWFVALVLGGGAAAWLMARAGMNDRDIAWSMLPRIAAMFVGSKLLYLIEARHAWLGDTDAFVGALFSAQMRLPGGLLLLLLVSPLISRVVGVRPLFLADTVAPAAGMLIVGVRTGCFLEGCCHGYQTSLPWGVVFPPNSPPAVWQASNGLIGYGAVPYAVHPLQIYFGAVGIAIFAGLAAYQSRKRYEGEIVLFLTLSYLWTTWLLEHLRARPHALTQDVVLAAALAATAIFAVVEWRRSRRRCLSLKSVPP